VVSHDSFVLIQSSLGAGRMGECIALPIKILPTGRYDSAEAHHQAKGITYIYRHGIQSHSLMLLAKLRHCPRLTTSRNVVHSVTAVAPLCVMSHHAHDATTQK
jgi:hypothetical protein